ncbi:Beta-1,4-galactosyltransferase 3 [Clonorchis sinensis]|uniref:Beta-1,4-galactosyltransferase n=2 Tax=Clonorchis sinensis TaxID=79923 RepID=A0A8T1LZS5_CLOSI|nr:Beta-1,4-galactosyltransferase 3 [Clonorchis sinensis]
MKKPLLPFEVLSYRCVTGIVFFILAIICLFHRSSRVLVMYPKMPSGEGCDDTPLNGRRSRLCCPSTHSSKLIHPIRDLAPTYVQLIHEFPSVCRGSWEPTSCQAHQKVAILIPFRSRELQLRLLLGRLHLILQQQNVAYSIFVIDQSGADPFNRGLLLNIGIRESLRRDPNINCFVFHDVDLLPENSQNLYYCDSSLRHLASGVDEFRYHVPFSNYAGGVTSLSKDNVLKINGFPNRYWGWGNEDDELAARCMVNDINLSRPPEHIGRYHAVSHVKALRGAGHYDLFLSFRGYLNDGLSALNDHSYHVIREHVPTHQTLLLPFPPSLNTCALTQLAVSLNTSVAAVREAIWNTAYLTNLTNVQWIDVDRLLRPILYTHITVDVSPIRSTPVQPLKRTRESWIWFLRFYGWI